MVGTLHGNIVKSAHGGIPDRATQVCGHECRDGICTDAPAHLPRVLLDAASSPMLPAARTTLMAALDAGWADPRRLYAEGRRARALLDQAREELAQGLGVRPAEVSFLPSGPAALRTGMEGLLFAGRRRGARMVATPSYDRRAG